MRTISATELARNLRRVLDRAIDVLRPEHFLSNREPLLEQLRHLIHGVTLFLFAPAAAGTADS